MSQLTTVTAIGLKSLPRRPWSNITTVVAITLVVLVLLAFLSIGEGFRRTVEGAGSSNVAVISRDDGPGASASAIGPDEISALAAAPGVTQTSSGVAALSPELVLAVSARTSKGSEANLALRGMDLQTPVATENIKIVAGRAARPGTNEIIVGRSAAGEFAGLRVGNNVDLGGHVWRIAGEFEAGGSLYESEARTDLHLLQSLFSRGPTVQIVRAELRSPAAVVDLQRFLRSNPQLRLKAVSEREHFLKAARSGAFIQALGWPLAIIMAIGALCGAANTMSSSTASRSREIGTLRAIGFRRLPIFGGVMIESLVLAFIGAIVGIALAWAVFDGARGSTLGSSLGQVIFEYKISPSLALRAATLALLIGALGGAGPAWRAARRPLREVSGE
jgi:putative ABC transport system permease protein